MKTRKSCVAEDAVQTCTDLATFHNMTAENWLHLPAEIPGLGLLPEGCCLQAHEDSCLWIPLMIPTLKHGMLDFLSQIPENMCHPYS